MHSIDTRSGLISTLAAVGVLVACEGGAAAPASSSGAGAGQSGASGSGVSPSGGTSGAEASGGSLPDPIAGGSGGDPSGAGSGGSGGAGSGGTAGGPVDVDADMAALAPLNRFQLLDPCDLTSYQIEPGPGAVCPQRDDVKNQHVSVQLSGDASVTYVVTLRVRGVVERYWYEGGSLDPVSQVFYTGGRPSIGDYPSACKNQASQLPFELPAALSPEDGCFNGFNVFAMSVSAPAQHFFLNYTADKDGDRPPHAVYEQDYTVSVEMQGQARLDFYVIGSDEHQCYNHSEIIEGVSLPSSPYIGEFLQFDVMGVKRKGT